MDGERERKKRENAGTRRWEGIREAALQLSRPAGSPHGERPCCTIQQRCPASVSVLDTRSEDQEAGSPLLHMYYMRLCSEKLVADIRGLCSPFSPSSNLRQRSSSVFRELYQSHFAPGSCSPVCQLSFLQRTISSFFLFPFFSPSVCSTLLFHGFSLPFSTRPPPHPTYRSRFSQEGSKAGDGRPSWSSILWSCDLCRRKFDSGWFFSATMIGTLGRFASRSRGKRCKAWIKRAISPVPFSINYNSISFFLLERNYTIHACVCGFVLLTVDRYKRSMSCLGWSKALTFGADG